MLKNLINWFLSKLGIKTQTTSRELEENDIYSLEYKRIDDINFNAIFSNKLANYVINDSSVSVLGDNPRSEMLGNTMNQFWRKGKKAVGMAFGVGGVVIVPYSKNGKLYFDIVEQNRMTIDNTDGELITGATILSEEKIITSKLGKKYYYRWTNQTIENGNLVITQKYTNEQGVEIPVPEFWADIQQVLAISNVDRCLLGYIKSPINNRSTNDKYGVPITYGCNATIKEIKDCLKQIVREFELSEKFVGVDVTMFKKDKNGNYDLPKDGLFKILDTGDDNQFFEFSPAIRESSYYARLQELYSRLEKEIGTSKGILTDPQSSYQNVDETRRAMYDTMSIINNMRENIEQALEDFIYACNVLCNAFNLTQQGNYELSYSWDFGFIEDTQSEWSQMVTGVHEGVISKAELRNWINSSETMEQSEKAVKEIEETEPTVQDLMGE